VKHYNDLSYFDYKIGLTYDWNSWMLGANLVGTDADNNYWYASNGTGKVRESAISGSSCRRKDVLEPARGAPRRIAPRAAVQQRGYE